MTITIKHPSRNELERRRNEILAAVGLTSEELMARRAAGILTPEEWEAWEALAGISYLLDD